MEKKKININYADVNKINPEEISTYYRFVDGNNHVLQKYSGLIDHHKGDIVFLHEDSKNGKSDFYVRKGHYKIKKITNSISKESFSRSYNLKRINRNLLSKLF